MYTLESDIPVPAARSAANVYPFGNMRVGDSFAAPKEERRKVQAAMARFGKINGQKFCIRQNGDLQVRCWRTA